MTAIEKLNAEHALLQKIFEHNGQMVMLIEDQGEELRLPILENIWNNCAKQSSILIRRMDAIEQELKSEDEINRALAL